MKLLTYLRNLPSNKSLALVLIVLAVVVSAIKPLGWVIEVIGSQKNLLANPSFELEDTSWVVKGIPPGSEQWEFDNVEKLSGNRSIKLYLAPSKQGTGGIGVEQQLPVSAGRQHELTAKFKYQSFEGENINSAVLLVKQLGANGQVLRNPNPVFLDPDYSVFERFQPIDGAWTDGRVNFELDKEARAIRVAVGLFGPSSGVLWVDDVNLRVNVSASSSPTFLSVVAILFLLISAHNLNTFFQPNLDKKWAIHLKKNKKATYRFFFSIQIGLVLLFIYTLPPVANWSKQYAFSTVTNWPEQIKSYLWGTKTFEEIVAELSFSNGFKSYQTELPVYDLHLTPDSIMRLESILQTIREQGVLLDKDQIWLDAKFVYREDVRLAKVRLRGDLPDHWRGPRKSWRVKFRPNELLNSTREINLIIPSDKAYISDYTFNYAARNLGLLTLRDQFVILKINGQRPSLYYEVEHFADELLVANNKSEGHIFTASDTWLQTILNFGITSEYFENDPDRTMARMRSYTQIYPENSASLAALQRLIEVLYNTRDAIPPEQIEPLLDVEKYLKYNALRMVFGSFHSAWGNNLKLYFDPTTGRFEPIPWDINNFSLSLEDYTFEKRVAVGGPLDLAVLRNNSYQFKRNKYLWDFLQADFIDMLSFYDQTFEKVKLHLDQKAQAEVKNYRQNLVRNAELLQGILSFSRVFAIIESPSYRDDTDQATHPSYRIELLNDSFSPLLFQGLSFRSEQHPITGYKLYADTHENGQLDDEDQLLDYIETLEQQNEYQITNINQMIYSDRDENMIPVLHPHYFFLVLDNIGSSPLITNFEFDLQNAITGETVDKDYIFSQTVYKYPYTDYEAVYRSREDFLDEASFFQPGEKPLPENAVVLPAGAYSLAETLIIPKGLEVYIEPGTQIFLGPDVSIISYSPIMAIGTEEAPISFDAGDDVQAWGVLGLALVESESRFEHVHFNKTGEARVNGIYFSGGLAAHNSDVYISNSQFTNATSEDALNIKNARAFIEDSFFNNNASDAIDLDWVGAGMIIGSVFENNAGDGVDLSGTDIPIVNNHIQGSGDKGISVGEMSSPLIFNNFLTGNQMGIAVKDLSDARILSNTLLDNNISLALYQKKAEFGGGKAQVISTLIWDTQTAIQLDEKSTIQIDASNNVQGGYQNSRNSEPVFSPTEKYVLDIKSPPELLYEAKLSSIEELTNIRLTNGPIGIIPSIYEAPSFLIKDILMQDQ